MHIRICLTHFGAYKGAEYKAAANWEMCFDYAKYHKYWQFEKCEFNINFMHLKGLSKQ